MSGRFVSIFAGRATKELGTKIAEAYGAELTGGPLYFLRMGINPHNDILIFERVLDGEKVLVMINLRDNQLDAPVPAAWQGKTATDLISGKKVSFAQTERLRPFEYVIVK